MKQKKTQNQIQLCTIYDMSPLLQKSICKPPTLLEEILNYKNINSPNHLPYNSVHIAFCVPSQDTMIYILAMGILWNGGCVDYKQYVQKFKRKKFKKQCKPDFLALTRTTIW